MTTSTERHASLIDAGWSVRLDGLWRPPPDRADRRAHTFDAAWLEHTESLDNTRKATT